MSNVATWCSAGVKFYCSKCGQEGHRSFYCPTVREGSTRVRFRCRLCGREGHNSRTCGKPKSEKEHKQRPHHCSRCGEKGHNRRNCPTCTDLGSDASGYVVNKVNGSNSAVYQCSICLEKGHNRRTCPKRKATLLKWKVWVKLKERLSFMPVFFLFLYFVLIRSNML